MKGFSLDAIFIFTSAVVLLSAAKPEICFSADEVGRVVRLSGISDASSGSGAAVNLSVASPVSAGQSIICHDESTVDIILIDGSMLKIFGPSNVRIDSCRKNVNDPPTSIRIFYGKIKISSKCVDNSMSLQVTTPSAEISAVMAEIAIVASYSETYIALYKYKAAVASSDKKITKAFILYPGEEIKVKLGKTPAEPESISKSGLAWWLEKYHLSDKHQKIRGYNLEEGPADWIIRRRDD